MTVVELRRESDLESLQSDWTKLLLQSASTIFLTWEWLTAWWSAYGVPGELRILAAYDGNGALCGIAPLRVQKRRRYGQTVSAWNFIGAGSNDSDYLDFIVAPGSEESVMTAFWKHWANDLDRGAVLELNEIPANSPNLAFLTRMAESESLLPIAEETPCGAVGLPKQWDDYLALLKPRFRTKVRSVLRSLENRSEVRLAFCENAEEVDQLLPELFDLHARRWAEDRKPGVFGWERKRDFYRHVSGLLLQRGWLRFSRLTWKGRTLACQYGFVHDGVYSQLQEGYEPESEHWNLGIGLRAWSIREFIKAGVGEYDFLGGIGRHKTDWGAVVKYSKNLLLARESRMNRLYCRGPEWEKRAKEILLPVVPAKILAFRKQRLAKASPSATDTPGGVGRMRRAVAECYFRLHVSGLARRLSNQYRLSFGANSRWPRLTRRVEATGRILYYHRVNDDHDPFFPSISTRAFDRLMRFVSDNYRVVSLTEMLHRLESGTPEQLMAITFDDGYRDNFEQAFPILQRYGLPATIFLATEPVDSGEPLWFEQLALALKKTSREFLDLDIDLPRRFPTRTPAERLEANHRIFALLRDLPDPQRRECLRQGLSELGVHSDERHGKMLTWNQIRFMKARGIDFGGHTVTHPFVSKLTPRDLCWEASECKRRIEAEIQAPAEHFAYPNGCKEDFGDSSKQLIRAAGYRAALTTIWGSNHPTTDRMELRRGGPWEENPALFASKLDWYELADQ